MWATTGLVYGNILFQFSSPAQYKMGEYRIPLPLTLDEFRKGQLFTILELSRTEGGEGVEFITQTQFVSDTLRPGQRLSGVYTHKIFRLKSKAPWFLQKALPEEAFEIHEESWNAYPYCKTQMTNPGYLDQNFGMIIESIHLQDAGYTENALNGPSNRAIERIDILDDSYVNKGNYNRERDPKHFRSKVIKRGPFKSNWTNDKKTPVMCAYKLATFHFKWTGLGGMVERTVMKEFSKLFHKFHRDSVCWMDRWYKLSFDEIRIMETQTAILLRQKTTQTEQSEDSVMNSAKEQNSEVVRS